jgi:hypothetical protein
MEDVQKREIQPPKQEIPTPIPESSMDKREAPIQTK